MSLALRLTFISIILTTCCYFFSYGYVESLDIPVVPSFETSYYFFFKAYISPKIIFITTLACSIIYWFVKKSNSNKVLKNGLRILFGILLLQTTLLSLAFIEPFQSVFFPFFFLIISILLTLNGSMFPYKEDQIDQIEKEDVIYTILSALLSVSIFYFYGSTYYKSIKFNQITINPQTNVEHKVRPLWTQSGNIYAITCPKYFNTNLPTSIMEYNNGKATYELNNLSTRMVRSICKYSSK